MARPPKIEHFINYKKKVGPLQAIELGYPGSGKSNHASNILTKCLEDREGGYKGEMGLMHGDIACEWRHYLNFSKYVKNITLIIPANIDIAFIPDIEKKFAKYKVNVIQEKFDYSDTHFTIDKSALTVENNINIVDYFKPNSIVVVYDAFLTETSRTLFWADIARQLYFREKHYDKTITYLCHEAHEIYPQTASGDQWKAVQFFASSFAYWRKRKIRALLLAHQETEVFERVRKKCYWRIYRDSWPTNSTHRRIVRKNVFNMAINKYHLFFGNLYSTLNTNEKMKEITDDWLMIPRVSINLNGGGKKDSPQEEKMSFSPLICNHCNHIWIPKVAAPLSCPKCRSYFGYSRSEGKIQG